MVPTTTQTLPKDTWRTYFDELSKNLGTMIVTVESIGKDIGAQIAAERLVLTGITYDDKDDIVVIGLDAPGGNPEEYQHIVYQPRTIAVATGDPDGPPLVVDVEDADAHRHIVRMELPPELPGD